MRRVLVVIAAALGTGLVAAPGASAHSAFLGSSPAPGQRLGGGPASVRLRFTGPLNERLSSATIRRAAGAGASGTRTEVVGRTLVLRPSGELPAGAYRVSWHTVSTVDGHVLEGAFSFGVRVPAVGGGRAVELSPLARGGWLRIVARALLYTTLLVLVGGLLLGAGNGRSEPRLVPAAVARDAPAIDRGRVRRRQHRLLLGLALAATGAAALSAVAEAADAAGGLSWSGLSDFLLSNFAGLNRVNVVGFAALTAALLALRSRLAVAPGLLALGAVAMSGHANAASPRQLAVLNDWAHLAATAVWAGGIGFLVLLWAPAIRLGGRPVRLALARHVLPRFGRLALPAFAVVLATGVISAILELGSVSALYDTAYGRVLIVKVAFVAALAAASFVHVFRLRPRGVSEDPAASERAERRHWGLVRGEPLLALGAVASVAVLVAFPLPPRQLGAAAAGADARSAGCEPCPLPPPRAGELAVAADAGSNLVAAWIRRPPGTTEGTVRVYGLGGRPLRGSFTVEGARQTACGPGCARFRMTTEPGPLVVSVAERGRRYRARLPIRWRKGASGRALRLLRSAQATMRGLGSVRELERVNSVPGLYALTRYRFQAPDRFALRTSRGVRSIVIGSRQWSRPSRRLPWTRSRFGGGLPFRTRSWFTWATYARHAYLLSQQRRFATVALMDEGTPAWWRLRIERHTRRVVRARLVAYGHYMTQTFTDFNAAITIRPPRTGRVR